MRTKATRRIRMLVSLDQPAPSFTTATDLNPTLTLDAFKGRHLILYFYPRDDTPGCTLESCGFRDAYSEIQQHQGAVLGVSKDSIISHKKFREKYNLPFELAADSEENLCRLYDVLQEKSMYGKKYIGIERSTFLIDQHGILRKIWRNVKVPGHIPEVLQALKNLG